MNLQHARFNGQRGGVEQGPVITGQRPERERQMSEAEWDHFSLHVIEILFAPKTGNAAFAMQARPGTRNDYIPTNRR